MISVCIATFNAGPYILDQLESILSQLEKDDEVIVFDDRSTDETISIIRGINDARVNIFAQPEQKGVIFNFESALLLAKGDYIFLADQDDVWLPGKVQKCMTALESHIAVVTDCVIVNDILEPIYPSFFSIRHSKSGLIKNILENSYIGCCMAFRKEILTFAIPFPHKIPMHDAWLGMVAELLGNVKFIPEQLLLYRRHQNNLSPLKSKYGIFDKLKFRLLLFVELIKVYSKILTSRYSQ